MSRMRRLWNGESRKVWELVVLTALACVVDVKRKSETYALISLMRPKSSGARLTGAAHQPAGLDAIKGRSTQS